MLIYVNQLSIKGDDAEDQVLRTIAGWIQEKTSLKLSPDKLRSPQEYEVNRAHVRCFPASLRSPALYTFLFTHPDDTVRGRQWVTELAVLEKDDGVLFSVLLETSDVSTRVKDLPGASQPKVVRYLAENCQTTSCRLAPDTAGLMLRNLHASDADYRAWIAEVERIGREHPLVLVSASFDTGSPLINASKMQEQLIGLAQVVVMDSDIDNWAMERAVGKSYCAWGGAINIIYPHLGRAKCSTDIIFAPEILDQKNRGINISGEVLSRITHRTNGYHKRRHISPYDARAKRQRDSIADLLEKVRSNNVDTDYKSLFEIAAQELKDAEAVADERQRKFDLDVQQIEFEKMELEDRVDELEQSTRKLSADKKALNEQLLSAGKEFRVLDKFVVESIFEGLTDSPTPKIALILISSLFPDRVTVLDSAFESAKESDKFEQPNRLVGMLYRLANEYYDEMRAGGDVRARQVFSQNEYSATESDTTQGNKTCRESRTFPYNQRQIPMYRHLRIGVADDARKTIRVYFEWVSDDQRIIIGYCGPHLPLLGVK
jgi:hypothetical protein